MIVFTDVETPPETKVSGKAKRTPASSAMLARMERELQQARGFADHPRRGQGSVNSFCY
jgi:hypothetical protein